MTAKNKENLTTVWNRLKDAMLVTLFIKVIFFGGDKALGFAIGEVKGYQQLMADRDSDKIHHAEINYELSVNRGNWIIQHQFNDTVLRRVDRCEEREDVFEGLK